MKALVVLFAMLLIAACGSQPAAPTTTKAEGSPAADTTGTGLVLAHEVQAIVTASCLPCHAPGGSAAKYDLTTPEGLARLVVPGMPDSSKLHQMVRDGKMPPSGKLDPTKIATIQKWIIEGAKGN